MDKFDTIENLEISLILGTISSTDNNELIINTNIKDSYEFVSNIINGDYKKVLISEIAQKFFGTNLSTRIDDSDEDNSIKKFIKTLDISEFKQLELMCIAISCLSIYVQTSYTGPTNDLKPIDILPKTAIIKDDNNNNISKEEELLNKKSLSILAANGEEEAYHLTPYATYLLIARTILVEHDYLLKDLKTENWWALRTLFLQQRILDDVVGS
ncbi:11150_t:CDS:2, partial [Entrophospora sp. SA101]